MRFRSIGLWGGDPIRDQCRIGLRWEKKKFHFFKLVLLMARLDLLPIIVVLVLFQVTHAGERTNKILVKLKPNVILAEVTAAHPLVDFEKSSCIIPNLHVYSVNDVRKVDSVRLFTLYFR